MIGDMVMSDDVVLERAARERRVLAPELRQVIESVTDPEIPTLSIGDMGIVRGLSVDEEGGEVVVTITPTYSGCPAMEVMSRDIVDAAAGVGYSASVVVSHNPPWTTEWLTERGREALRELHISPPEQGSRSGEGDHGGPVPVTIGRAPHTESVACPRCGSSDTELISRFGTTACKALHRCRECGDPFDEFKAV